MNWIRHSPQERVHTQDQQPQGSPNTGGKYSYKIKTSIWKFILQRDNQNDPYIMMEKSISQSNIKNALKLISMYTNKTSRRKKLLGGSYRTTWRRMTSPQGTRTCTGSSPWSQMTGQYRVSTEWWPYEYGSDQRKWSVLPLQWMQPPAYLVRKSIAILNQSTDQRNIETDSSIWRVKPPATKNHQTLRFIGP